MRTRVKWIESVKWVAQSDSGHGVVIDGSPDIGGENLGPRPMELVLMGLGGCTAMDVISILKKQRQAVTDCVIELEAKRAESIPKVFEEIHITYRVSGKALRADAVNRAVDLSATRYCSVSKMLEPSVILSHSVEIVEDS